MLVFLLLLATVLPWGMKEFRMPGGFFLPPVTEGKNLVEQAMGLRYHVFWSWDFYLVMLLTIVGPSLPLLAEPLVLRFRIFGERAPRVEGARLYTHLAASAFVYLAGLIADAWAIAAYVLTGKAYFRATNDAADVSTLRSFRGGFSSVSVNHALVFAAELLTGAGFLSAMFAHRNLWFFAPGTALVLSPLVARFGWENRLLRSLTWLPLMGTAALLFLIGCQLARRH